MKHAQVINMDGTSIDSVLIFDGDNVIYDDTQETIGRENSVMQLIVDVNMLDAMSGAVSLVENVAMDYVPEVDCWTIDVADIATLFDERHKYVALVSKAQGESNNMRSFKIKEFCVDSDHFEDTWMRLPYRISIGTPSKIEWFPFDNIDFSGEPIFSALAYQGGSGVENATSAANVTHRGPIIRLYP